MAKPAAVVLVALAVVGALAAGIAHLRLETDFVDAVPASPEVAAYRGVLAKIDGTRFVAIHMPSSGADLRSNAGFDQLVDEQRRLLGALETAVGTAAISHSLGAYEAMRQSNYMFAKFATAGRPPDSAYALPSDPVTTPEVRRRAIESADDVLARDGSSALLLVFLATNDASIARRDAAAIVEALPGWHAQDGPRVTGEPQASGLLVATLAAEAQNRMDLRFWGGVSLALASAVLLIVMRRPTSILVAAAGLAAATAATFGLVGWLGLRVDFLTVFLAPMVAGIGMDYALHVLHAQERLMKRLEARAALARALRDTAPAIAASAATTAAGLLVFLLVPAPLFRQVGLLSALAVALGFLASVTLVPALRALVPQRSRRNRRDGLGSAVAAAGGWSLRHPAQAAVLVLVLVGGSSWLAAAHTRVATGTSETELPADDPGLRLQRRIEAEYGSFQRSYLVVEGDLVSSRALRALDDATTAAAGLPLHRGATSITTLLRADAATDEGIVDAAKAPVAADGLPASDADAQAALRRLRADPLWSTLVPFVVSTDDRLAVVAIRIDPWDTDAALLGLRDGLREHAAALQNALGPAYRVHAAGSPVNRAASLEQTDDDVLTVTVGATLVVAVVLAVSWSRRPGGLRAALACAGIVAGASVMLLATVPLLDGAYGVLADLGAPRNSASLTQMFLLAFAVTVSVGIDGAIHIVHRAWVVGDPVLALRDTGRAVTGTAVTTVAAFAPLAGLYFLQSKNLAILVAAGAVHAYALTILVVPHIAQRAVRHARRASGQAGAV